MTCKTIQADLHISVLCDCPHCDELMNLLDSHDFENLNDEGQLINNILSDSLGVENWHKEISCPSCGQTVVVEDIIW